ncbi:hypothetical protein [Agrobacterium cavarae]
MSNNQVDFEYIPLGRTFRELSSSASESDDSDLSKAFYESTGIGWSEVLRDYRVVILSEAGSGKTEEFRTVSSQLRSEGKAAFFLRLENIAAHFSTAFEIGTEQEFTDWLGSGEEGWVFLDSIDEARLRHPKDFELALRLLGNKLRLALDRTHIFLSGRMSAWRPKTDLERSKASLPFAGVTKVAEDSPERAEPSLRDESEIDDAQHTEEISASKTVIERPNATAPFRILTLEALSHDQVETFAAARNVNDVKVFIGAIERADAWSFAALPQDLEDLIASWLKRGEIGSRRAIIEDGIERRLKERDQERADAIPLSDAKAWKGALLLAAATTLTRNPSIQVPDGKDGLDGIPVDQVLPDWSPEERKALLERPIFDAAIYGAVRFHHRTVREYLTAEWLREMLRHPASRRAIESMFFAIQYGVEVVVPVMRPILPWVALYDDRIREKVRRIAPEVLFEAGDPSSLPLPTRRQVLNEITQQLTQGRSPTAPTHIAAVQRFAHPDLCEDIRSLLSKHEADDEAASFLLRMIWIGEIKDALPEAKQQALLPSEDKYRRIAAIRAVQAVGSDADVRAIREAVAGEPSPPTREWLSELCETLKESDEELDWLLNMLARTEARERYAVDSLQDAVTKFVQRLAVEKLPRLLEGIRQLLSTPPYKDASYCRISTRYSWLLTPAASAIERFVKLRAQAALSEASLAVLGMLAMSRHFGADFHGLKADFTELVPSWPELNRALFWSEVARARADKAITGASRVTRAWQAYSFGGLWKITGNDFDYFIEQILVRSEQDDKLVALSAAIDAYVQGGRGAAKLSQLKKAVTANPEAAEQLELFLHPPKRDDEYAREDRRFKRQAQDRARREKDDVKKAREYISKNLGALRDPGFSNPNDVSTTQWYLHNRTRNSTDRDGKWASGNWRSLIPDFGEDIARTYRDGAILHAHRARPDLRSEGTEANRTSASVIFGLSGLAIEARETDNWAENIKPDEVERIWRFASHELNGFPNWFPRLYAQHSEMLIAPIMKEVEYEISAESDEGMHYIIDDLAWSGKWAWAEIGPAIFDLLREREPRNEQTLNKLLTIVLGSAVPDDQLESLARLRIENAETRHPVQWYAIWTGINPGKAIPAFAAYLEGRQQDNHSSSDAMNYANHLFGDRFSDFPITRTAFKQPRHLEHLYVLLHRHIPRSDDIDRANGEAYSPTLRDRAQDSRNAIFNLLQSISGKEAYLAMKHIADKETDADAKRWIAHRARQRAAQDADMDAWTAEQVQEFEKEQERTPRNHRELTELAVNHLLDLKSDMEDGDSSIADVLLSIESEEVMRNFLGRELERMSSGRYQIPQEEELADEKRPDLRFHGAGISGPVPTELKIADKWTGPQLFERLENQLSGDYLRDRRSSRGIFLLVNRGKGRNRWQCSDGSLVDFENIVDALQVHWQLLSPVYPNVEDIRVIGIDLTRRRQKPLILPQNHSVSL